MKAYAEVRGTHSFDWNDFLNQSAITEDEWIAASRRAKSWVTCAVGNQFSTIPRDKRSGRPLDPNLNSMGSRFYLFIEDKNVEEAKICLRHIERRSAELIAKINQKGGQS